MNQDIRHVFQEPSFYISLFYAHLAPCFMLYAYLRQGVEGIEHLDDDQHRHSHCARRGIGEDLARVAVLALLAMLEECWERIAKRE